MKVRTLMAAAALLGIPGVAMADGMPTRGSYCCESVTWSGMYIGIHSGAGWGDAKWTLPAGNPFGGVGQFPLSPEGGLFGGQFGFNHQIGMFLIGTELSISGNQLHDKATGPTVSPASNFRVDYTDLFTATGRVGLVLDKVLIYGKGGYASSDVQWGAVTPGVTATGHRKADGWVAGGGLEYRLRRSLVLGVEYSYVALDKTDITATTSVPSTFVSKLDDLNFHTVTARLSILLDRGPLDSPMK